MSGRNLAALALVWAVTGPTAAYAQSSEPWPGRFDVTIGAAWTSGFDLGQQTAEIRRNEVPVSSAFPLFRSSSEIRPTTAAALSLGYRLTRLLIVEGYFGRGRPTLRTRVFDDAELSAGATAEDQLTRYVVGGSAVLQLEPLTFANGRGRPFVTGGAGYLREVHEGGRGVETGRVYHLGGGVKLLLVERGSQHLIKGLGIRTDVRALFRGGGVELGDTRPTSAAVSVGLMVLL